MPANSRLVIACCFVLIAGNTSTVSAQEERSGPPGTGWQLVFEEQFDGSDADLDARWFSQNGPSGHILCSRWRDNAKLDAAWPLCVSAEVRLWL